MAARQQIPAKVPEHRGTVTPAHLHTETAMIASPMDSPLSPQGDSSSAGGPIRVHPRNPKLFEFRGRPLVLVTATEHYGSVMNRPFRYKSYLEDVAAKGITLTRLFTLFRELQTPINPYSTCKPESTDYVAPFERVGPDLACDGQPKFDLGRWNDEFFERLHGFLCLASQHGIIVEVVFLSNTYEEGVWRLNPLHPKNNVNGLPDFEWPDIMSTRQPQLFEFQCAHVRKIVEQTRAYDNVIYEICNEPGTFASHMPGAPTADEVNDWQRAIADVVRAADDQDLPHLIAGQEAAIIGDSFDSSAIPADLSLGDLPVDVANVHPLPHAKFAGTDYDLGLFMSGQLHLRPLQRFALDTYGRDRPLNFDEDNAATQYRDLFGWTIHRKRAWTVLFCGGHYDMIDFSILPRLETGTEESNRCLRSWFGHLSHFIHSLDLVNARPLPGWLEHDQEPIVASIMAVEGKDYCIYLADAREFKDPGAGTPLEASLRFDLPAGTFQVATFSPVSGLYSPWVAMEGGPGRRLGMPAFEHDLVVRVRSAT